MYYNVGVMNEISVITSGAKIYENMEKESGKVEIWLK
jgi:hypothetical protein